MLYLALVALSFGMAAFLDLGNAWGSDDDPGSGNTPGDGGSGDSGGTPTPSDPAPTPTKIAGTFENDTIDLRNRTGSFQVNLHEGNDTLYLGDSAGTVFAGTGADKVIGGAGDDVVYLGDGRDQWDEARSASTGDDLVRGGRNGDKLVSRSGADTLWGDLGADDLYTLDDSGAPAKGDTAYGGFGKDRLWLDGGDVGFGGQGADQFTVRTTGGVVGSPTVIGDFAPREDMLIIDLPAGQTASHSDLGHTGTDGTRITLTLNGAAIAVLDNVWFADLTPEIVQFR